MKTRVVWGLLIAASVPLLSSCSKDNPKPDPIVGVWTRDYYQFSGAPNTFSTFNGFYVPNSTVSYGIFYEDAYTLAIKSDKTYEIRLDYPGPDSTDAGKWAEDAKTLTLTSNTAGVLPNTYTLEQNVTATQLVFSNTMTVSLLPDVVKQNRADTATAWSANHPEAYNQYYQDVDVKVTYYFKKNDF